MRRFPSSWDKTLSALGFRRNVKRIKRELHRRKGVRIESLERREMLSVSPGEGPLEETVVTPTLNPTRDGSFGPIRPVYVLADSAAGDTPEQFEITTEYTEEGAPQAVIKLKEGLERIDRSLQELTVELRVGDTALARHEVLIDLTDARFEHQFQQARLREIEADTPAAKPGEERTKYTDWLSKIDSEGKFTDLISGAAASGTVDSGSLSQSAGTLTGPVDSKALPPAEPTRAEKDALSRDSLDRVAQIAKRQRADGALLEDASQKTNFYMAAEKSLAEAKLRRDTASLEEKASDAKLVGELALTLNRDLVRDLESADTAVAAAAKRTRDELLETADPYYTMLSGLDANHELTSKKGFGGRTDFAIHIVETGELAIDDTIRVELGDYDAMVQTELVWMAGSSHVLRSAPLNIDLGPVRDATVSQGDPTANDNSDRLTVKTESGGAFIESGGLISIEAENWHDNIAGTVDDWFERNDQAGYSGDGFVRAELDDGDLYGPSSSYLPNSPRLDYQIEVSQPGTYHVWVRAMRTGSGDDSIHLGLNGQAVSTGEKLQLLSPNSTWNWSHADSASVVRTIDIATAGTHTLNLWMREDGARVDKIVLTDDANYTPTGTGPAESATQPITTAGLLGFDLSQYAGHVPTNATLKLTPTAADGSDVYLSQHGDLWGAGQAATWDESTLDWDDYQADLESGFGSTIAQATPSVGSTTTFNVTETIQRSLMLGDSNLNGANDHSGAAGDVETFHLAVTDFAAYKQQYAGLETYLLQSNDKGLIYRNDANLDGVVDFNDSAAYFERVGASRGDFNLDGEVDGKDYSLWAENFGATADRFGQGDANFNALIDTADYTVWRDAFGETFTTPTSPDVTFRLLAEQDGVHEFYSSESATSPPELSVSLNARAVIGSFDTVNGKLRVNYEIQNGYAYYPKLSVYQVVDGARTLLADNISLQGSVGSYEQVVTDAFTIANPESDYTLVAEIEGGSIQTAWREFQGGVFQTSDGAVHAHATAGDDTITYEDGRVTVSDGAGEIDGFTAGAIDFRDYTLQEYDVQTVPVGGNTPLAEARDDGQTLHLENNTWKAIALPYTVTADTVVEFDFQSGTTGELHGFGFDTDLNLTQDDLFRTHGTQAIDNRWEAADTTDYQPSDGLRHYRVRVGDVVSGSFNYLYFIADNDAAGTGDSTFSNFRIYEDAPGAQAPVYAHAHQGDDTLAIENHVGADVTLVGGAGDDTYLLTAESYAASAVSIDDEQGLDEIQFPGDWTASTHFDLDESGVQTLQPVSSSMAAVNVQLSQSTSLDIVAQFPTGQVSGRGYSYDILVDNPSDLTDPDHKTITLREAVALANLQYSGDSKPRVIGFDGAVYDGSLVTTKLLESTVPGTGSIVITGDLTIVGPGADRLEIDGDDAVTPFVVSAGVRVSISGLLIRDGYDAGIGGGAIHNAGDLHLNEVDLYDNESDHVGGAVYSTGSLHVANSVVRENRAHAGAGLYQSAGQAFTLQSSQVIKNIVTTTSGSSGGINLASVPSVVIADSVVTENEAAFGGGISLNSGNGTTVDAKITNSEISKNKSSHSGGGLDLDFFGDASLEISNTTIAQNEAVDGGGGISHYDDGSGSGLTLTNVTLAKNLLSSDGDPNTTGVGAGIYFDDLYGAPSAARTTLENTIVFSNVDEDNQVADLYGTPGSQISSLIGIDPNLSASLEGEAGQPRYYSLASTSQAIDGGSDAAASATDQRGRLRYDYQSGDTVTDIGAYEYIPSELQPTVTGAPLTANQISIPAITDDLLNLTDGNLASANLRVTIYSSDPLAGQFRTDAAATETIPELVATGNDVSVKSALSGSIFEPNQHYQGTIELLADIQIEGEPDVFSGQTVVLKEMQLYPDVFVVNSLEDARDASPGDGIADTGRLPHGREVTLRAAIEEIEILAGNLIDKNILNWTPTIEFAPGLTGGQTIELDPFLLETGYSQIRISRDLSIVGPGSGELTIDAGGSVDRENRIFTIAADANVSISGLTITGGYTATAGEHGGGIRNRGHLSLEDVHLTGNRAVGLLGGGVFMDADSSASIINSTIDNNHAHRGGAIYASLTGTKAAGNSLIIDRSTLHSNTIQPYVTTPSPTLDNVSAIGGAIFANGGSNGIRGQLRITNSTFASNKALPNSELDSAYSHRSFYAGIDAWRVADIDLFHNTFVDNVVSGPTGAAGAYLRYSGNPGGNADVNVYNNLFYKNQRTGQSGSVTHDFVFIDNPSNNVTTQFAGNLATGLVQTYSGFDAHAPSDLEVSGLSTDGSSPPVAALLNPSQNAAMGAAATVPPSLLNPSDLITRDQRGVPRGASPDVGAVEHVDIPLSGDFDGDGRPDEASIGSDGSILVDLGVEGVGQALWGSAGVATHTPRVGDFNGDGRDDLAFRKSGDTGAWSFAFSESTRFHVVESNQGPLWHTDEVLVGDFDGDGADELIGRLDSVSTDEDSKWRVLGYEKDDGVNHYSFSLDEAGHSFLNNPSNEFRGNTFVGDANRDGRDDLIGSTSPGNDTTWFVALSKGSGNAVSFAYTGAEINWGDWYDGHYHNEGGQEWVDADGPLQFVAEKFAEVYDNVELELYHGIRKGPIATLETKSGSPYDQAALLTQLLSDVYRDHSELSKQNYVRYEPTLVTGTINATVAEVANWLGATEVNGAYPAVPKLLELLDPDFVPNGQTSPTAQVSFRHAWVRLKLPRFDIADSAANNPTNKTTNYIDLDPSWQQGEWLSPLDGVDLPTDILDTQSYIESTVATRQDGTGYDLSPQSPVELLEERLQDWLTLNHPGASLADIPIRRVGGLLKPGELPIGLRVSTPPTNVDDSWGPYSLAKLEADAVAPVSAAEQVTEGLDIIDQANREEALTYRFTISLDAKNTGGLGFPVWSHSGLLPRYSQATILNTESITQQSGSFTISPTLEVVHRGHDRLPDGPAVVTLGDVSFTGQPRNVYTQTVQIFAPGSTTSHVTSIYQGTLEQHQSLAFDVGAHSAQSVEFHSDRAILASTSGSQASVYQSVGSYMASSHAIQLGAAKDRIADYYRSVNEPRLGMVHITLSREASSDVPDSVRDRTLFGIAPDFALLSSSGGSLQAIRRDSHNPPATMVAEATGLHTEWLLSAIQEQNLSRRGSSSLTGLRHVLGGGETVSSSGQSIEPTSVKLDFTWRSDGFLEVTGDATQSSDGQVSQINWVSDNSYTSPITLQSGIGTALQSSIWNYLTSQGVSNNAAYNIAFEFIYRLTDSQDLLLSDMSVYTHKGLVDFAEWRGSAWFFVEPDGATFGGTFAPDPASPNQVFTGQNDFFADGANSKSGDGAVLLADRLQLTPVGVASGELSQQSTDVAFPNIGVTLSFGREYNSRSYRDVGFGVGWTHSFSDRLYLERDGDNQLTDDVIWYTSTGAEHRFEWINGVGYKSPPELLGELERNPNATEWTYVDRKGVRTTFEKSPFLAITEGDEDRNPLARIASKVDLNGNGFAVKYTDDPAERTRDLTDRIDYVYDIHTPPGPNPGDLPERRLHFTYYLDSLSPPYIQHVDKWTHEDLAERATRTTYDYTSTFDDTIQRLTDVWLADVALPGETALLPHQTYSYHGQGTGSSGASDGLLSTATMPNGNLMAYDYYPNGRVSRITTQSAPGESHTATYAYDLINGKTTVRDENGNEAIYQYNEDGLATRVINPDRTLTLTEWGKEFTGVSGQFDADADGIVDGTEYLRTMSVDEVGAVETFVYYTSTTANHQTAGGVERELYRSTSKQFPQADGVALQKGLVTEYEYIMPGVTMAGDLVRVSKVTLDPEDGDQSTTNYNYTTSYSYYNEGLLKETENALGQTTKYTYYDGSAGASEGLPETATSPRGSFLGANANQDDALDWRVLHTGFAISGDTLTVTLKRQTSGKLVAADAVRIERIDQDRNGQLVRIVDDGDTQFSSPSGTQDYDGGGVLYGGDAVHFTNDGLASWDFEGLEPGNYRVSSTWVRDTDNSDTMARYTVYDGAADEGLPHADVDVDQTELPGDGDSYNAFTLTYEYDAAGNISATRRALSDGATPSGLLVSEVGYHHAGVPVQSTDGSGVITESEIDDLGRLRRSIFIGDNSDSSDDLVTSYIYDESGRVRYSTDALDRTTETIYDGRGLVKVVVYADDTSMTYEYDGVGNRTAMTDELDRTTRYAYDDRNRLIATTHPDGETDQIVYDGVGRIVKAIDALGRESRLEYDAAGRVIRTISADPDGDAVLLQSITTHNKYNALGELIESTDGEGNVTQRFFDKLSRVTKTMVLADADASSFSDATLQRTAVNARPIYVVTMAFDADGNAADTIVYDTRSNSGALTDLATDGLHAAVAAALDSGDPAVRDAMTIGSGIDTFDAALQRTQVAYDNFGRPVVTTYADGTASSMAYDAAGRVRFVVDARNAWTENLYDKYGRLEATVLPDPDTGIAGDPGSPVITQSYDKVGNVVESTDANKHITAFEYDSRNRLVATTDAVASGSQSIYDVAGQMVATIDALGVAIAIQYDQRGRMVRRSWVDPDGAGVGVANLHETRSYDAVGNVLTSVDARGVESTYTYDNLNRLKEERVERSKLSNGAVLPEDDAVTKYKYDDNHNVVSVTDAADFESITAYDELNRVKSTTTADPDGYGVGLSSITLDTYYDSYSNVVRTIERPAGSPTREDTFQYDQRNRLTFERLNATGVTTDEDTLLTLYKYDDTGNLTLVETAANAGAGADTENVFTRYEYDLLGRQTREHHGASTESGQGLHEVEYAYDPVGSLKTETYTIHDVSGIAPSQSTVTEYEYDEVNRPTRLIQDALGIRASSSTGYDAVGNVVLEVDPTGLETHHSYDALYRLTKTVATDATPYDGEASLLIQQFSYDEASNVLRSENGEGNVTEFIYDTFGLPLRERLITDNDTNQYADTLYTYDSRGNRTSFTDPNGNVTSYEYDGWSRVTREVQDNNTRSYHYRDDGNLDHVIDRNDRKIAYDYDDLDRVVIEYWYDTSSTAPANYSDKLSWTYDKVGRLDETRHVGPSSDNPLKVYSIDAYGYDKLDRVASRKNYGSAFQNAGPEVGIDYTHDDLEHLRPGEYQTSKFELTHEPRSTPWALYASTTVATDALGRTVRLSENDDLLNNGDRLRAKDISFAYDDAGRMTSVARRSDKKNPNAQNQYVLNGSVHDLNPTGQNTGNDFYFSTNYAYDTAGRLDAITHARINDNGVFATYDYGYDNASRITSIDATTRFTWVSLDRKETQTYDDAGRLKAWTQELVDRTPGPHPDMDVANRDLGAEAALKTSNGTVDFAPDAAGNLNHNGQDLGALSHNRIESDDDYSYTYDHEGNLTSRTVSGGEHTQYVWDHRNRLVKIITLNAVGGSVTGRVEYRYNTDDLRIRKVVFDTQFNISSVEHYIYDGDQVAAVLDGDWDQENNAAGVADAPNASSYVQRRIQTGPGTDESLFDEVFRIGDYKNSQAVDQLYWAVTDHAGSVRDVLRNSHDIHNHVEYDAHGDILFAVNENKQEIGPGNSDLTGGGYQLHKELAIDAAFAGREWDDDADLYYNRARWYDAGQGRFISEDPIGFAGGDANIYRYGGGDPVNYRDPSGLIFDKILGEAKRVVNDVGDFVEDSGDYLEEKYKETVRSVEYIARNPEDAFKTLAKDPWFWAGLAVGSVTFSWGFFNASYSVSGFSHSVNYLDLAGKALNLAKGGSLNLGLPTIGIKSPLLNAVTGAVQQFTGGGVGYAYAGDGAGHAYAGDINQGSGIELASYDAPGGVGHHWVPQSVFYTTEGVTRRARAVLEAGTSGTLPYKHAFDTWTGNGMTVTHGEYNNSVRSILGEFVKGNGGSIGKNDAEHFLRYIRGERIKPSGALKAAFQAFPADAKQIRAWRTGFFNAAAAAEAGIASANKLGIKLGHKHVKAIAQLSVNGYVSNAQKAVSKAAKVTRVMADLGSLSPSAWRAFKLRGVGKALGVAGFAFSASRGYAGSHNGYTGALGSLEEVTRDLVFADSIDYYLLDPSRAAVGEYVDGKIRDNVHNRMFREAGIDEYGRPK